MEAGDGSAPTPGDSKSPVLLLYEPAKLYFIYSMTCC